MIYKNIRFFEFNIVMIVVKMLGRKNNRKRFFNKFKLVVLIVVVIVVFGSDVVFLDIKCLLFVGKSC